MRQLAKGRHGADGRVRAALVRCRGRIEGAVGQLGVERLGDGAEDDGEDAETRRLGDQAPDHNGDEAASDLDNVEEEAPHNAERPHTRTLRQGEVMLEQVADCAPEDDREDSHGVLEAGAVVWRPRVEVDQRHREREAEVNAPQGAGFNPVEDRLACNLADPAENAQQRSADYVD